MKREIPLEKIYENLSSKNDLLYQNVYIYDYNLDINFPGKQYQGYIGEAIIVFPCNEKTKHLYKPFLGVDEDDKFANVYKDINQRMFFLNIVQEYILSHYRKNKDEPKIFAVGANEIRFNGLNLSDNTFTVFLSRIKLKKETDEEYQKRKYLETLPQNVRDEFGDELLSI